MTTAFMVFGISANSAHLLRLVPGRARPAPWHGTRCGVERRRLCRGRAYEAGAHSSSTNVPLLRKLVHDRVVVELTKQGHMRQAQMFRAGEGAEQDQTRPG